LLENLKLSIGFSFLSIPHPPEQLSIRLSRKEHRAKGDTQASSEKENYIMESNKREGTRNLGVGERWCGWSSDRAESGESSYQTACTSSANVTDDNDAEASDSNEIFHFPAGVPSEHPIKRIGQHEAPRLNRPKEELEELWAMQDAEIKALRAEKWDLQENLDELDTRLIDLRQKLSKTTQVKNELESKIRELGHDVRQGNLVNGQLAEQNEELRRRLHEFAAGVREGRKELSELSRTNDRLLGELKDATDDVRAREKMIEALQAKAQQLSEIELRNKLSQAESDTLRDELVKAHRQIKDLVARQREMAMQIPQTPSAKSEGGEDPISSLEDEIRHVFSLNARDQEEEEERDPDHAAHSTMGTQSSEPAGTVDKRDVGAQATRPQSTESQEKPREIEFNPMSVETAAGSGSDARAEAAERGHSTRTTHIPETPVRERDLTPRHNPNLPGQLEVWNTQTRTSEGNTRAENAQSSVESTFRYASIVGWVLFLCLALSWWFSQNDKELWMQANAITRKSVVEWRDERWTASSWLARRSFDAENMLEIDRSVFA
jgi:myosin heavy subunit